MPNFRSTDSLVLSYLELRRIVGVIGIALPAVLVAGKILLESPGLLDTISAYYYSIMGNVFVGSLSAIAVFLFSYRGYDWRDALAGRLGAIFSLGIAFFPVAPIADATALQKFKHGISSMRSRDAFVHSQHHRD